MKDFVQTWSILFYFKYTWIQIYSNQSFISVFDWWIYSWNLATLFGYLWWIKCINFKKICLFLWKSLKPHKHCGQWQQPQSSIKIVRKSSVPFFKLKKKRFSKKNTWISIHINGLFQNVFCYTKQTIKRFSFLLY